ncbi:MAG: response regulator [Campylobacteraceae bacterium]
MSRVKILIVEDESITALDIKESILEFGYEVVKIVTNTQNALCAIKEECIDLVLLDITLKDGEDGVELGEKIRKITDIPIVFLTANEKESTVKRAININPSGYILKPFRKMELKSAIEIAINNYKKEQKTTNNIVVLEYGYSFDCVNSSLTLDGVEVELNKKEINLLEILIKNANRVVTKEWLEEYLYNGNVSGEGALRSLLFRLRQKIHKDLILNISGVGYKINKR